MSELMDNHIGIMNWDACKKCIHWDIFFKQCGFFDHPDPNVFRHFHIDQTEVTCKDYEEIL